MFEATQALSFVVGANRIFIGDKLPTVASADEYKGAAMIANSACGRWMSMSS